MSRHAYLIVAHHNFDQLSKLLHLLDDERNDIYVHIDKKCQQVPVKQLKRSVKYSNIYFIDRSKVTWGGYSAVQVEVNLLKEAIQRKYDYYHLLSGDDLPIKTQDYIHSFFDRKQGKEFVGFDKLANSTGNFYDRFIYYHFFPEIIGRHDKTITRLLYIIEKKMLRFQKRVSVDRQKNIHSSFYKGTNWFSISHQFAAFLVEQEAQIKKTYKYSLAADEVFVHSILMNSSFKSKLYDASMRLIDWERGRPYTFTKEDYDMIINSKMLFARKFNEEVDHTIIDQIYEYLLADKSND